MTDEVLPPSDLAPRRHPLAVSALILAIAATAAPLPALIALAGGIAGRVVAALLVAAPFLAITSLVMASVASRQIERSSGRLTGRNLVGVARAIAILGPVAWILAIMVAIGTVT